MTCSQNLRRAGRGASSIAIIALLWAISGFAAVSAGPAFVTTTATPGAFPLHVSGVSTPLFVDAADYPGVLRAAAELRTDVERVTGVAPSLSTQAPGMHDSAILIGTIGQSALIDGLIASGKLSAAGVAGRWEAFVLEVVNEPLPGIDRALVIAGSDKRGTIFGIYELSYQIGVSPWHYWADVPPRQADALFVHNGRFAEPGPAVKYRGIFLNDENPALYGWVNETFGGFNADFYETVFELILRLRGNFLWPAMWGKSIYDDDPRSPELADEMGVVLGTSHHEPMSRAHVEWERYGTGAWNYETNPDTLRAFWRTGIERMGDNESLVTIGMRGDGDEAMTEGTAIALLEQIVNDQREIIEEVTGKPAEETPQVWALYKEVQDYYDKGMRVPDDVTLLFADDNWGNIRRLPELGADREGGFGIYYHFDYVGAPRNYKWINTNQISRVWEQMHLAYRYGADRLWVVNVGDLKPVEFPIEFFLDYAWNPDKWPADRIPEYTRQWAEKQFGEAFAPEIAHLLSEYSRYNSRRKPELLAPETFSLTNYREWERVATEYDQLAELSGAIYEQIPEAYRDAYYQLVQYPVEASANLYELYHTVALNRLFASQGRAVTNSLADRARALFDRDEELARIYHEDIADGKWVHMMSQTHIGYTIWQQPEEQIMPEVQRIDVPDIPSMGVAVEGSTASWPRLMAAGSGSTAAPALPTLSQYGLEDVYLEIFNRGAGSFTFEIVSDVPWLKLTPASGEVRDQQRVSITADWSAAPAGSSEASITVTGSDGTEVVVQASVRGPELRPVGFTDAGGYVSIEAPHFTNAVASAPFRWQVIPELGRTHAAVAAMPVTAEAQTPGAGSPHLEYRLTLQQAGTVTVHAYFSPSFDFRGTDGLRYAVSFDDADPVIVNMHDEGALSPDTYAPAWMRMVADNVQKSSSTHVLDTPGEHVLKIWMVDPGVVLQKLVVDAGGLKESYLGPPESRFLPAPTGDAVSDPTASN